MKKENHLSLVQNEIDMLKEDSRFMETMKFMQHGNTSVYEHSVKVAYLSCKIAYKMGFNVDYKVLIRGALLHDYFLYDWHDKEAHEGWHGFRHPKKALKNAREDFALKDREEDIILKHMFPLVPFPPKYKESWIVCIADKLSAILEIVIFHNKNIKIY